MDRHRKKMNALDIVMD